MPWGALRGPRSPGATLPLPPGWRVTVGPFVTSLALHIASAAPPHSVRQDGDGTGQERGAGEEPPEHSPRLFPAAPRCFREASPFPTRTPFLHL